MCEKILLIDGHSILNRAFYGLPDLTNSEGLHTGAVYGFLNILFKVLGEEKPEYLAVAFDRSEPTFRHAKYPEYKGTRKPMPQELKEQMPLLKEMLEKMGIATVSLAGFEADDILGTLAKKGEEKGLDVNLDKIEKDIEERDYRDMHRECAPLMIPEGAVIIDSSDMTIEQVVDSIIDKIDQIR